MKGLAIYWMRRDLRLEDNAALFQACKSGFEVQPVFIFDKEILDRLEDKQDARVTFIHDQIRLLQQKLRIYGSSIRVYYGRPMGIWEQILTELPNIKAVFVNRDYEPYARERDTAVKAMLQAKSISFIDEKDHVIFDTDEVLKDDGLPYTVFTPYKRKWLTKLNSMVSGSDYYYFSSYHISDLQYKLVKSTPSAIPSLAEMGFAKSDIEMPSKLVPQRLIMEYDKNRDFPAMDATTKLGLHFRFGTISVREKARKAMGLNDTFLSELIWRDFYSMILYHFPHVAKDSFRPEYDQINWVNNEAHWEAWKGGKTGYPIVDAGMRQLNTTGYMHNRVRMVVASFLTKHLLIDWRWGEAYFAQKLLDFDLASNNGGWQWAAGCGTDAAPYFRIFNPTAQQERFDKQFEYVKKWVPEYGTARYPNPIVDHKEAREKCLATYKAALKP